MFSSILSMKQIKMLWKMPLPMSISLFHFPFQTINYKNVQIAWCSVAIAAQFNSNLGNKLYSLLFHFRL